MLVLVFCLVSVELAVIIFGYGEKCIFYRVSGRGREDISHSPLAFASLLGIL